MFLLPRRRGCGYNVGLLLFVRKKRHLQRFFPLGNKRKSTQFGWGGMYISVDWFWIIPELYRPPFQIQPVSFFAYHLRILRLVMASPSPSPSPAPRCRMDIIRIRRRIPNRNGMSNMIMLICSQFPSSPIPFRTIFYIFPPPWRMMNELSFRLYGMGAKAAWRWLGEKSNQGAC